MQVENEEYMLKASYVTVGELCLCILHLWWTRPATQVRFEILGSRF